MPLILTEAQRVALSNRMMLQPPSSTADVREFARFAESRRRAEGLPADVLLTLEIILMQAEQGNRIAGQLYMEECRRLGITHAKRFV